MGQFIEGIDRQQALLLPEFLDDYVGEDSPVRAIDAFIDQRARLSASKQDAEANPV